jgi:hypothetical protein
MSKRGALPGAGGKFHRRTTEAARVREDRFCPGKARRLVCVTWCKTQARSEGFGTGKPVKVLPLPQEKNNARTILSVSRPGTWIRRVTRTVCGGRAIKGRTRTATRRFHEKRMDWAKTAASPGPRQCRALPWNKRDAFVDSAPVDWPINVCFTI